MYHVGDSIEHDKFGSGIITDVQVRPDPYVDLLTIEFDDGNIKRFPADSSKIKRC